MATGKKRPPAIQRILKTLPNVYEKYSSPSKAVRKAAVQRAMSKNLESILPAATPGGPAAVYAQTLIGNAATASGSNASQIYEQMLGEPSGQASTLCAKQESDDESAIAASSSRARAEAFQEALGLIHLTNPL